MATKTSELALKTCIPCTEAVPPLRGESIERLFKQLGNGWEVKDEHHLEKSFVFPDFKTALSFTVRCGNVVERENHHPNIETEWGKVTFRIWTHKIRGLHENDFILAAKMDQAFEEWKASKVK